MTGQDVNAGTRALGDAIAALFAIPAQMATSLAAGVSRSVPSARSGCSCGGATCARCGPAGCEIPPPCWEPRPAGTCRLQLTPGATGTLRIHVSNCDWTRRVVLVTAIGRIAAFLKFDPTTLVVGPQECETFRITVRVPDGVKPGECFSGPVLVRGCVDHYIRLEVTVADCAGCTCCDVTVSDCADNIHHWYDHFYCARPCRNPGRQVVTNG